MKKKAVTLIELIAVLVIMAILALIVTPLVMNIIRKARIAADKRSIDAYGRSVDGYTYGSDKTSSYAAYTVGDQISYNNIDYYVIKDLGVKEPTVTLLKAEPLTVDEVNLYGGVGTENNHVNIYNSLHGMVYDQNGYCGVAYYSSETCINPNSTGCEVDYDLSDVKYIVDAWANDIENFEITALETVDGYKARLITFEELLNNLGYTMDITSANAGIYPSSNENVPNWVWNSDYSYWTMSQFNEQAMEVWDVSYNGNLGGARLVFSYSNVVRPVVTIKKSAL